MKFLRLNWPVAAVAALAIGHPVAADFLTIYGAPSYDGTDRTSGSGYQSASGQLFLMNGSVYETLGKFTPGMYPGSSRGVRWDKSGSFTEFQIIGALGNGYNGGELQDVNSSATSVGYLSKYVNFDDKGFRAVKWNSSGVVSELATLGTSSTGVTTAQASAINTLGTVAGYSQKWVNGSLMGSSAVRWSAAGAITELGNLGLDASGFGDGGARDINDAGVTVGSSQKYVAGVNKGQRAVRWDAGATAATELGTLNTSANLQSYDLALKINQAGTIIGFSDKYINGFARGSRPVKWGATGTAASELGILGTDPNGVTTGGANDINESGVIVGRITKYLNTVDKGYRAVRWNPVNNIATDLAILNTATDGTTNTNAMDINESGWIAGDAFKYIPDDVEVHAVVWRPDGSIIDLNSFVAPNSGWVRLDRAFSIDENLWVTGTGLFDPDGAGPKYQYFREFIMQVPEPSALMLLVPITVVLNGRARSRQAR